MYISEQPEMSLGEQFHTNYSYTVLGQPKPPIGALIIIQGCALRIGEGSQVLWACEARLPGVCFLWKNQGCLIPFVRTDQPGHYHLIKAIKPDQSNPK